MQKKLLGVISVDFVILDQLLVKTFCVRQILEKKWECSGGGHKLFIDFEKNYDSVRRVVLYKIFIEFCRL